MRKTKRLTIKEQEAVEYHYKSLLREAHKKIKFQAYVYFLTVLLISVAFVLFMAFYKQG